MSIIDLIRNSQILAYTLNPQELKDFEKVALTLPQQHQERLKNLLSKEPQKIADFANNIKYQGLNHQKKLLDRLEDEEREEDLQDILKELDEC